MLAESLPALSFRSVGCGIRSGRRLLRTRRFSGCSIETAFRRGHRDAAECTRHASRG